MSSALRARTGRHRQRYDDHLRLVAGCIPYKMKQCVENDTEDFVHRLEILMISSPNRNDLVFPKGGWEDDETVEEAACREALEEAGVRGIIEKGLGEWRFRSKSRQNSCSTEGTCKGYMFALKVTEELDNWPEKNSHERRWVSVKDAWSLCRYEWMCEALTAFISVLSRDLAQPPTELSKPSNWCFDRASATERAVDTFC
ncbi:nudix hydrolase 12, mitochondrial-like isoform X2 [Iris pallida]|uniref:Nudix hydrolase 12, mitochondrial-like isoform X2 n=1 Tax=Iris pallida TaxID=29817 RepID=A0AAX6HWQ6_IRIPA|nr:nudix hydrolase 12, mitochondrial-like isoform X2 [Iris pallida]